MKLKQNCTEDQSHCVTLAMVIHFWRIRNDTQTAGGITGMSNHLVKSKKKKVFFWFLYYCDPFSHNFTLNTFFRFARCLKNGECLSCLRLFFPFITEPQNQREGRVLWGHLVKAPCSSRVSEPKIFPPQASLDWEVRMTGQLILKKKIVIVRPLFTTLYFHLIFHI